MVNKARAKRRQAPIVIPKPPRPPKQPKPKQCPRSKQLHAQHTAKIKFLQQRMKALRSNMHKNQVKDSKTIKTLERNHKKFMKESKNRSRKVQETMKKSLEPDPQAVEAYRNYY